MEATAKTILEKCPKTIDLKMVCQKYPVLYEQSMNSVLAQEVIRYWERSTKSWLYSISESERNFVEWFEF